ncbi:MAG: hypothetical protein CMI16_07500 [Opitutaceae bacterium]|nr:hypothetical protein [Opitutaceae bacterium]
MMRSSSLRLARLAGLCADAQYRVFAQAKRSPAGTITFGRQRRDFESVQCRLVPFPCPHLKTTISTFCVRANAAAKMAMLPHHRRTVMHKTVGEVRRHLNVFPNLRGVLMSTSELHFSQLFFVIMAGLCCFQSAL